MIRRLFTILLLIMGFFLLSPAPASAKGATKHTIHATARPYQKIGHAFKIAVVKPVAKASVFTFLAGFDAFDAAVIDPLGVGLQAVADFLDMSVGQPLEKLPEPFEAIGDGVHVIYLGIDKVGQVLAR